MTDRSALRGADAAEHLRRGNAMWVAGRVDDAVAAWRQTTRLRPDLPEAHYGIGRALLNTDRLADSMAHLREAVRLRPDYGEALNMLGCAFRRRGDLASAAAAFADAVRSDPAVAEPRTNLGAALYELGRLPEAIAEHEHAVRLRPAEPKAHFNLAVALLAAGHWARGWPEYEWRRHVLRDPADQLSVPQPPWTGWDPAGATLLVVCEQGLGDTLQFIRYVPVLADAGARVAVVCQPPLRELLRAVRGVWQVVGRGEPLPPFDAHVQLLSLPGILGTRPDAVPAEVPYVHSNAGRQAAWARRLAGPGFKVGVVWQGNNSAHVGNARSFPLAALAPLARVPGVRLFSLQKHVGTEQLVSVGTAFDIETFDPPLDPGPAAFLDTAAVAAELDLVVTCDTSIAHLAGAVGARTWVALSAVSDWRWMRGRDDSPWYPTVRLFRQRVPGDWADVFERMAAALGDLARPGPDVPPPPSSVPVAPGDLLDRLSILHIKARRITDAGKVRAVRAELDALTRVRDQTVPHIPELDRLAADLRRANEEIWQAEDAIRAADAAGGSDAALAKLARRIYQTNDLRADLKRQVNVMLGSPYRDEKQYGQLRVATTDPLGPTG